MNANLISLKMLDRQRDLTLQEALCTLESDGQTGAPCHLWEDHKAFHVELSVPGWQPHQLRLGVENDIVMIEGKRSVDNFLRQVRLPASVSTERARAAYCNGVLTISFRKWPRARARRILIEVA
jgi:HSP20 family molecular chaperone IbpA